MRQKLGALFSDQNHWEWHVHPPKNDIIRFDWFLSTIKWRKIHVCLSANMIFPTRIYIYLFIYLFRSVWDAHG